MQKIPGLYIADSEGRGRGVFCANDIQKEGLIEICPMLIIPKSEIPQLDKTYLFNYYFLWEAGDAAIALGYGSLYNHSKNANADIEYDYEGKQINIYSIQDIAAGEEIFYNYTGGLINAPKIWFNEV